MERDLERNPYTESEQRVADWLIDRTQGLIEAGDDPIGFLLASYERLAADQTAARTALVIARQVCGKQTMNCVGAKRVKAAVEQTLRGTTAPLIDS